MRSPFLFAFALATSYLSHAAAQKAPEPQADPPRVDVATQIVRAVVYSREAAISRRGTARVEKGRSLLMISGLPPALVEGSLRARLPAPDADAAGARIRAVNYELIPQIKPQRADEVFLAAQLNELDLKLKIINDERALLNGKAALLKALKLPAESSHNGEEPPRLTVAAWSPVLDFVHLETAAVLKRLRELNGQAKRIGDDVKEKQEALATLQRRQVPAVAAAIIDVDSPKAGNVEVEVTYSVRNVVWYPSYTFKVDPDSGQAEMIRYASVAQNTGEDWDEVAMVFSTGERRHVAELPTLAVWQIVGGTQGGHLEPAAAGDNEPLAEKIMRPGALPQARDVMVDNPLAALGFLGAGRLRGSFGYQGQGSLGQALRDLANVTDVPLGGTGVSSAIGVGGGGSGAFGHRSGGGRRRVAMRFGASRASESAVDASLRWLARTQRLDGSWHSRDLHGTLRMDEADTALTVLAFLGAGHTEKIGKFKDNLRRGLAYLISRQSGNGAIGRDLWTRALAATALAEAYGMARIQETRFAAQRAVSALAREISGSPWALHPGLTGTSWPSGPSNLALVAMAFKSAKVAGMRVDSAAMLQVMSMLDELEAASNVPVNAAAAIVVRQMIGFARLDDVNRRDAKLIMANLPRWHKGRIDFRYIYYGTLAMFQLGGDYWKVWNRTVRAMLVEHQRKGGPEDGSWDPIGVCGARGGLPHAGASRAYATALASLSLEVYYRYLPLYEGAHRGSRPAGSLYVPPIVSSGGRDFRLRALQTETLQSTGVYKLVAFERRALKPRLVHHAVPIEYRGAFLQAEVPHEGSSPLLAGEARIFVSADYAGSVFLNTVEPGEPLVIPLGLDRGVRLARQSRSKRSRTGFRGRQTRTEYAVTLSAANNKARPIHLVLRDRIPRPTDARIRVTDVNFTGGQPAYDPQSDSGEVRFELELLPGKSAQAGIAYVVEVPSNLEAVIGGSEE